MRGIVSRLSLYQLLRAIPWAARLYTRGVTHVMDWLHHAGELSFLTALGAGLGRSVAGRASGVVVSTLGTGAIGTMVYAARGLGPGLGAGAGLLSGLVGSLLTRVAMQ